MKLSDAPKNRALKITAVDLPQEHVLLLLQLGLSPGEKINFLHTAPLGDPCAIEIGQQVFSLRKEICEKIMVEECSEYSEGRLP